MCLPIQFKEGSRVRLCKILVGIEVCCIILAKMLSHHGFRYRKDFRLYTSLVEGYDAGALPLLLIATGLVTSLANLFGVYVSFRSMYPSLRHRMVSQMSIYIKVVMVVIVLLHVCCFFCYLQQSLINDTFKNGIMSALKRYRTEPKIKEDIDQLQLKFKCCGNEKYTDWFQVNWISDEFVDVNLPEEQKKLRNGNYETDDVPFSCCDRDAKRPCVKSNVHDNLKNFNYVYQKDLTLFKDGCRTVLVEKADRLVAFVFTVAILLIFLELSIAVLARHFVTSVQDALDLGDPTATTYGYLAKGLLAYPLTKPEGDSAKNNSAAASSSPSAASSTTAASSSSSVEEPQPSPTPPPTMPLLPRHRRLPSGPPPQPPPSLSQTARRPSKGPSYQMVPSSPSRRDITSDQTTIDLNDLAYARTYGELPSPGATYPVTTPLSPYAHPTMTTSANDGFGIEHPDPRGSRSPSFYDQSLRRM